MRRGADGRFDGVVHGVAHIYAKLHTDLPYLLNEPLAERLGNRQDDQAEHERADDYEEQRDHQPRSTTAPPFFLNFRCPSATSTYRRTTPLAGAAGAVMAVRST